MAFENDSNNDDGEQTTENQNQSAEDTANQQAAAQGTGDDHQTVFLVAGERAFGDREAVVKNIENAQSHILTLEAEGKVGREALAKAETEITRLKKIEDGLDGRTQMGNVDTTHQLSNDEIAALAADLAVGKMKQSATVEVQNKNLKAAEARAEAAYGEDNYKTKIGEIAVSLSMSMKAVDELGKSSPSAFDRLFLPTDPGTAHQPSRGSVYIPTVDGQEEEIPAVNVTKLREPERIAHTKKLMEAAGITY